MMDEDVRRVMEFRFLRRNTRWRTVSWFNCVTDRSIDRRIVKGIMSVAETLKLLEEI